MKQLYILVLLSCSSFLETVQQNTESLLYQDQTPVHFYVADTHPADNHDFHVFEIFENSPGGLERLYLEMQNSNPCFRCERYNFCLSRHVDLPASISNSQIARSVQAQIRMTYPHYNNRRQEELGTQD